MFGQTDIDLQRAADLGAPPPKGQPYSVSLPGTESNGRSAIYRHWKVRDGPLLTTLNPAITTAHEAFEATAARFPKNKCLGHRPYDPVAKTWGQYVWEDYETIQTRRKNFGVGLVHLHRDAGVQDSKFGVGLWCQNRPEWQITDLAAMSQGLFTVSIYDTLGPDTTEYIINHASLHCVVTSLSHVATLLKLKPRIPTLKLIVVLDPLSAGELPGESKGDILNALAADLGIALHYIKDVEALGETQPLSYSPPHPEDIVTINYTSGTTGNPKGVLLKHKNAVAATSASQVILKADHNTLLCSFLPLAHIYQRLGEHHALSVGAAIGYFHGNIAELVDDLKVLRPTTFAGVPRLYNRFGVAIKAGTLGATGVKGALSRHVIGKKLAAIRDKENPTNTHALYDRIWSKKVAANVGLDRCTAMVSGSAPIDPSLHEFLRICFSNYFPQGYGLTETYACTLIQQSNDFSSGTCGGPVPSTECCLLEVPDMEYYPTDKPHPRGELLIRATSLFSEYYRNEEETKKAIDSDGWFHTGDICSIDELGRFKIIDRRKNVLKLSQGEYISPERIENVYLANLGYLATAYVHGDSHQSCLVGIFGITPDTFAPIASKALGEEIAPTDIAKIRSILGNKKVEKAVLKSLDHIGKKNKFNSWEKVKAIRLFIDPFTVDNELLTPTLKLKRPQTAKKYRQELDDCYEEALQEEQSKAKAKL